jgi:hypothetical protein
VEVTKAVEVEVMQAMVAVVEVLKTKVESTVTLLNVACVKVCVLHVVFVPFLCSYTNLYEPNNAIHHFSKATAIPMISARGV